MARAALLVALVLAPALPAKCGRAAKSEEPPPTATAVVPVTSATTPPVWTPPPDTNSPPSVTAPANPELAKARAAAQAGDSKKVRALLEKKVRGGKGNKEEATLLIDACAALRDKACAEAVKAKHPEVDGM